MRSKYSKVKDNTIALLLLMHNASSQSSLVFRETIIRYKPEEELISLTDLWAANSKRSDMRPDRWIRLKQHQELLETINLQSAVTARRDKDGLIVGLAGTLEIIRGGSKYFQGTFAAPVVALAYANCLSGECYKWLQSVLKDEFDNTCDNKTDADNRLDNNIDNKLNLPINVEDFGGKVRFTPDGRISVYDAIGFTTGHQNSRQVWNDLKARLPEVVQKTDNFQFPGKGQRSTPVANLQTFLEILVVLPGKLAAAVREEAVRTLIRKMQGDPSLVEEILSRIQNPEDLKDIANKVDIQRSKAYGLNIPIGIIDNPLDSITSEIRKGYGWVGKEKQMEELLVSLATYRGMFVLRQSPHRPYSRTAKDAKSRRIDLVLQHSQESKILNIYEFKPDYIDEIDVTDTFLTKAYPEIAFRDFSKNGEYIIIAHLVAPAGITRVGVERLKEVQVILNKKYSGKIRLNALMLDELVWGEMYPAIQERFISLPGTRRFLHSTIKPLCEELCSRKLLLDPPSFDFKKLSASKAKQLTIFDIDVEC